ncbi:hypothetical protein E4V99_03485 [Microbacterium sp. dk485]|nr:hypothetical protein E4V99_03485 [Microbacterium sp. dk485]
MSRVSNWVQNSQVPVLGTVGRSLLSRLRIYREYTVDRRAYVRSSSWTAPRRQLAAQRQRDLTFWYHQVEKALTFPEVRRPFGAAAEANLNRILSEAGVEDVDPVVRESASRAREALALWNDRGIISEAASPLIDSTAPLGPAPEFFLTRSSCRNFDPNRKIDRQEVRSIVALAQRSPSVCNRQGARVHYLSDRADIAAALALQSGNRGFGQTVSHLAIVTADRRAFSESTERNQGWIDGALFAMTFVWALHAHAIASCMLNWSMGVTATRKLRATVGIPEHEDVICMIAFGYPAPNSRRARSERLDLDAVLTEH